MTTTLTRKAQQHGEQRRSVADTSTDLALDRCYGDYLLVSGTAPETHHWLPGLPAHVRIRTFEAPGLHLTLRGTEDFFARRVSLVADRYVVVVLGTCFDRSTCRRLAPRDVLDSGMRIRNGNSLWGQFGIVKADLETGSIEWLNDLQSSFSPWVHARPDALVAMRFAPLPSLTGATLDPAGAGEFLVHGITGGIHTPVAGWQRQAAASHIGWQAGRETRHAHVGHPFHQHGNPAGDPIESFADRLRTVLDEALVDYEAALLPLTGGIDSRLLLAALLSGRSRVECYTHGTPGCADDIVTREYNKRLQLSHRFHAITEEQHLQFEQRVLSNLARLGPDYDSLAYPHLLTSYQQETPDRRLFAAGVGTGIHKIPYMPITAHEWSPRPLVEAIVAHYGRMGQAALLLPSVAESAVGRMRQAIEDCVSECPSGTSRVHRVQYYHMQQRLGRWASKGMQLQDLCGYDIIYPFMEPQLMQTCHRFGFFAQHLGQKIIRATRHLQPELLDIDNANGWPCTVLSPGSVLRNAAAYGRGLRNYLHRRRSGQVATKIAIVDYRQVYRGAYRDWSVSLLDPGRSHLGDILSEQALTRLHTQLQAGVANPKTIGPLMALELWCRS
jgi:hypothetical protein